MICSAPHERMPTTDRLQVVVPIAARPGQAPRADPAAI